MCTITYPLEPYVHSICMVGISLYLRAPQMALIAQLKLALQVVANNTIHTNSNTVIMIATKLVIIVQAAAMIMIK